MIKIHDTVKEIVDKNVEVKNMLAQKLLNLSQYAQTIQKTVEKKTMKRVSIQSIVVSLSRIQKKLKVYNYLPHIDIDSISVRRNVVQFVYPNTPNYIEKLSQLAHTISKKENVFFSFSTNTKDISIIVSETIEETIKGIFTNKPKIYKNDLSAISIHFDKNLVEEAGVGYSLMHKIASKRIILDEVTSTFNEFTLIFSTRQLHKVLEAFN